MFHDTQVTYHSRSWPDGRGMRTELWQMAGEMVADQDLARNMTRISKHDTHQQI